MKKIWSTAIILFGVLTTACAPLLGTLETENVAKTQETIHSPSATIIQSSETAVAVDETGTISGKICFSGEVIPSMIAYFINQDTKAINQLAITENQTSYTLQIEPGDYVAFAYRDDSQGGMYSEAVACGLSAECTDHSLRVFTVLPGQKTEGIDICDWYAQDQLPPLPGETFQNGPYLDIAGLVYSDINAEETWWIAANGFPQRLYPEREAKPSPGGSQLLIDREDDIWLVDLISGEEINLTADSDRLAGGSQWWPANPEVIVFNSTDSADGWGMSFGQASIMHQDGSDFQVLDESSSLWAPAPSPDGKTIAYDTGVAAWLYHLDTGRQLFDVRAYGLDAPEDFKIGSPAWSPDGKQITWWVGGSFPPSGEWIIALALFDLQTREVQFIHQYQPLGGSGGWKPPAQWSPDGQWLVFTTQGQGRVPELIAMRVDGSEVIPLGSGTLPLWSPDSRKLVFIRYDAQGSSYLDSQILLVERDAWQPVPLELSRGSLQIQWSGQ